MIMIMAVSVPAVVATSPCPPCPNSNSPGACDMTSFETLEPCLECSEWTELRADPNFVLEMIDDKCDTPWVGEDGCPFGYVGYINQGSSLQLVVEFWGLTNQPFQLTLNGPGTCTAVDSALASGEYKTLPTGTAPALNSNLYERGYYNGNPSALAADCGDPGQGIYNFEMNGMTDANGHYCGFYAIALPPGDYPYVKFIVKECGAPGCLEGPWTPVLCECNGLSFTIAGNVEVYVENTDPVITDMWIEQDPEYPGVVIPNPCEDTTTITVYEEIYDANGIDDIASVVIT